MGKPGIPGFWSNWKLSVPHAQSWMTTLFLIGVGSTPVLLQKHSQSALRACHIFRRIHRTQQGIVTYATIKLGGELLKYRLATDSFEKGLQLLRFALTSLLFLREISDFENFAISNEPQNGIFISDFSYSQSHSLNYSSHTI